MMLAHVIFLDGFITNSKNADSRLTGIFLHLASLCRCKILLRYCLFNGHK